MDKNLANLSNLTIALWMSGKPKCKRGPMLGRPIFASCELCALKSSSAFEGSLSVTPAPNDPKAFGLIGVGVTENFRLRDVHLT